MLRTHERSSRSKSNTYGVLAIGLVAIIIAVQCCGLRNKNDQSSLLQIQKADHDDGGWSLLNRPAQKFIHAVDSFSPSWLFQEDNSQMHDSDPEADDSGSGPHIDLKYAIQKPRIEKSFGRKPQPSTAETNFGAPAPSLTFVSKSTPSWIDLRAKRLLELLDAPPTKLHKPANRRRGLDVARQISADQAPTSITAVNRRSRSASRAVSPAHLPPVSPSNIRNQLSSEGMQLFTDQFHPLEGAIPAHETH